MYVNSGIHTQCNEYQKSSSEESWVVSMSLLMGDNMQKAALIRKPGEALWPKHFLFFFNKYL